MGAKPMIYTYHSRYLSCSMCVVSLRNHRHLYCAANTSKDTPSKRKANELEDDEVQLSHVSLLLACQHIQMSVRHTIA